MTGLQTHQPDHLYCVYCHAEAVGPCATCRAMICADCAVISGGSVKRVAVCKRCDGAGRGDITGGLWSAVRWPLMVCAGAALAVWLLTVALR